LTPKTRITLIDDVPESSLRDSPLNPNYDPFGATKPLHNAQVIDLTSLVASPRRPTHDPLDAEIYYKAHRKAERAEKSARNSERERAQHEKVQLDRLLDGLKGPDWLKVMGITGVTESEKKLYEPKRALFTREVTALIKKFEDWKEEEKRQKERKKQEMREVEEREVDDGEDGVEEGKDEPESPNQENSPPPASNFDGSADYTSHEVDALAARQLHQETTFTASGPKKKAESDTTIPPLPTPPPAYKPFKSFYSKRHLRDAAVAGHRRGRAITAFGEPVPELDDHEFELPPTILTEDAVRASSRRKRRQRRGSSDG
jgi:Something about silencing, SAS, complex subunit 4